MTHFNLMAQANGLKILAWISVVLLAIIAVYISRFLLGTIMLGLLLTYMLVPIYEFAFIQTKSKRKSSLIAISTILMASALVILFSYRSISLLLAGISADVAQATNITSANLWASPEIFPSFGRYAGGDEFKVLLEGGIMPFLTSLVIPAIIQQSVEVLIIPLLKTGMLNFALALPTFLIQLTVATFFAYYLLLNGKDAAQRSPDILPEGQRMVGKYFLTELNGVFKTLFTTNFDIAAYNALVGIIIFSLIGVPLAAVWAIMAAFLSLIRFLGPWLIFVPLSIFLFWIGDFSKGFLVLLFGIALLEYVPEYILRPRMSVGSSPVNIALAFLSYVAPIFVLGLLGIIIGPFVFGLLIAAYRTALHFNKKELDGNSINHPL